MERTHAASRSGSAPVSLDVATTADALLLGNLLELYMHDLSAAFPAIELGDDGRYGYHWLALYWREPERRFAFVIRHAGKIAGFALATRGSPVTEDPEVLDVAEFFVARRYRRSGVGRHAAFLLWQALPGKWTVRASEGNPGAVVFWRSAVAEFTHGTGVESERSGEPHAWRVFSFEHSPELALQSSSALRRGS
jgi:predicted acetyltransferase